MKQHKCSIIMKFHIIMIGIIMIDIIRKTKEPVFARKLVLSVLFFAVLLQPCHVYAAERLQDVGGKTVIVIDPGHGGENLGTIENGHLEKEMTLITAQAMYDELILYDDIEVYMTRTDDRDISLKERAKFAEKVNADFLFSIHYNASLSHEVYGTEVWVSKFPPYNAYGYQFGCEFLKLMEQKGLFVRGIKTRISSNGIDDYYGIIRESVERDIPAVILEHCHVDEARDEAFCSEEEQLKEFGREDAAAAARYFGLKSSKLQVDYSDYPLVEAPENECVSVTVNDSTEPDSCLLEFSEADYEKGLLTLQVTASDSDTALIYYSYSTDGGKTFSGREPWPESDTLTGYYPHTFPLTLTVASGECPEVVLRAYNLYDLYAESNVYVSPRIFPYNVSGQEVSDGGTEGDESAIVPANALAAEGASEIFRQEESDASTALIDLLTLCLTAVFLLLTLLIAVQCLSFYRQNRKRKLFLSQIKTQPETQTDAQIRNDEGDTANQQR